MTNNSVSDEQAKMKAKASLALKLNKVQPNAQPKPPSKNNISKTEKK